MLTKLYSIFQKATRVKPTKESGTFLPIPYIDKSKSLFYHNKQMFLIWKKQGE